MPPHAIPYRYSDKTIRMTQLELPKDGEKVWLITGSSSGFGWRLVISALSRGDFVIATARNIDKLKGLPKSNRLHHLQLDITDGEDILKEKLDQAVQVWGKVDVLVNNAGFFEGSLIEEGGSKMLKKQFATNVYGTLDVTTAALPHMRQQRSGTIVIIGSRSSWRTEWPGANFYCQSKAAINVLGETLAIEVAQFSIKVLIVLPGAFRTEGRVGQDIFQGNKIADYNELRELVGEKIRNPPDTGGDPKKAMEILVDVVRGEGVAEGKAWPLYLPLGRDAEQAILDKTETVGEVLKEWKDVICSTDFEKEE